MNIMIFKDFDAENPYFCQQCLSPLIQSPFSRGFWEN